MSATATQGGTTRGYATRLFWGVARGVAPLWVLPALIFNLDWGHGLLTPHNIGGIGMVLGSAVLIDVAVRRPHWFVSPVLVLIAGFLVYTNTKAAMRNLSFASEAASEAKSKEIAGGSQVASQRSQLEKRREAQVQVAGETAVGVLEAAVATVVASDPKQWKVSSQCEAPDGPITGAFCKRVAEARAKVEAAKKRDVIDVQLAGLPMPATLATPNAEAPVADAYTANMVGLLREAGYRATERLVRAEEALTRALGFELLAAFVPTCWLILIDMLEHGASLAAAGVAKARAMTKRKARPESATQKSPEPPKIESADDIDRMIADEFEDAPVGVMKSGEIRPIAKAWFEARGVKLDENQLWARMRVRFKHDVNNNRPRYIGLKPRVRGLRLVVNE